jgi:predicted RecA/RadA family phage recombinase
MPNALRTATPPGDWRSFKFTCEETDGWTGITASRAAGTSWLFLVQDTVGALIEDVDFGDEGVLIYHAEKIMVPKLSESTDIFLPGDRVYWDPTTRFVTPTYDSAYYWIGIATEPAAAADTVVEIDLKGDRAEAEVVLA